MSFPFSSKAELSCRSEAGFHKISPLFLAVFEQLDQHDGTSCRIAFQTEPLASYPAAGNQRAVVLGYM
jgi:hypothetical protein